MDIEILLRKYPDIPEIIQKYNTELNKTLQGKIDIQDTLKASSSNGVPKSSKVSNSTLKAVEMSIDKYDEHILYLTNQINFYLETKKKIDLAMQELKQKEYRVIELLYFDRYSVYRVRKILHYEKTQIYEFRNKALQKLQAKINQFT
ncbi:MAG: hypothetical protein MJA84_03505 [Firmicutes bacterium]|nr:hypothetical protein [Bacillota bacterium]